MIEQNEKKSRAVSLKLSSSFLFRFLSASIENLIFTSVNFLSVIIFSTALRIFLIIFLASCIVKFFKHSIPNESKKRSVFGSMSNILHQCVPFFLRSQCWLLETDTCLFLQISKIYSL